MPSFNIHLAIAIKYCEKNYIKDKNSFYLGAIEPDLVKDKTLTHYTKPRDKNYLEEYLFRKVDLKRFLENENIDTDYNKGVFLHLITDFIFFTEFLDKDYIRNIKFNDFIKCLYYSYNETNEYLNKKYDISEGRLGKELIDKIRIVPEENTEKLENILPIKKLDEFIEQISNIDLELYSKKILNLK